MGATDQEGVRQTAAPLRRGNEIKRLVCEIRHAR
jgi:hypothetical protein